MTNYDFVPSNVAPFSFSPTLDGATYNCVVTWNVFGRRYYLSCYDLAGNLVFTRALVGSPGGIELQAITWSAGTASAVALTPHGYAVGSTILLTIAGANPAGYNGTFKVLIVDDSTFEYALAADPGSIVTAGAASRDIDIAASFFSTSKIVYRAPSRQFEVTP